MSPHAASPRQGGRLRRYTLGRWRFPVAGGRIVITGPARQDELFPRDPLVPGEGEPYWAEVWPASVGLARHLMRVVPCAGRRALDLGSGLGLAGVAAGMRGASVLFVDRDPEALHFAGSNARGNGVASAGCLRLDWNRGTIPGMFDLILLADVTYDVANHPALLRHLRACLAPGGLALVADPYRPAGDAFLRLLDDEFRVTRLAIDTFFDGGRVALRIAEARA